MPANILVTFATIEDLRITYTCAATDPSYASAAWQYISATSSGVCLVQLTFRNLHWNYLEID